jgi:small nuclear ribonucleoprotein (snRNP)-like protein
MKDKKPERKENTQKKENILSLDKYKDKKILVKYQGGRQVVGVLSGFDNLQNLVLDETVEYIRGFKQLTRQCRSYRSNRQYPQFGLGCMQRNSNSVNISL